MRRLSSLACILIVFAFCAPLRAEEPVQPRLQATLQAQRWSNPMGQSLMWLGQPQIQKELDIVPEQKEKLTKLQMEIQGKMGELMKVFQSTEGDQTEKWKKYSEEAAKLGEETDKKVKEILLAHQVKRIEQILLQQKLSTAHYGTVDGFFSDDIVKALEITDAQKEDFRKRQEEVRTEVQQKTQEFYKKLADESREKLLGALTPTQRKKLDDLIGPKYEWQAYQWGGQAGAAKKDK